jgi:hypothetical protein
MSPLRAVTGPSLPSSRVQAFSPLRYAADHSLMLARRLAAQTAPAAALRPRQSQAPPLCRCRGGRCPRWSARVHRQRQAASHCSFRRALLNVGHGCGVPLGRGTLTGRLLAAGAPGGGTMGVPPNSRPERPASGLGAPRSLSGSPSLALFRLAFGLPAAPSSARQPLAWPTKTAAAASIFSEQGRARLLFSPIPYVRRHGAGCAPDTP